MMGSGNGGADTTSLAALLAVAEDPATFASKLQELTKKADEAKTFLEQAKDVNVQNVRIVKEITAKTDAAMKAQAEKEADLVKRETELANRLAHSKVAHDNLAAWENKLLELEAKVTTGEFDLKNLVKQHTQEHIERLKQADADIEARRAQLESELAGKLAAIHTLHVEADGKHTLAKSRLEEGTQLRDEYQAKVTALKDFLESL